MNIIPVFNGSKKNFPSVRYSVSLPTEFHKDSRIYIDHEKGGFFMFFR